MTYPRLSPLSFVVVPLRIYRDNCRLGSATGFFYKNAKGVLFLVTNKHALLDERMHYYPNRLLFDIHTKQKNDETIDVKLIDDGGKSKWIGHPHADIAAVKMEKELSGEEAYKCFEKRNVIPDDIHLGVGENLLVAGYPLEFYDEINNLPIIRNATIATEYGIDFRGEKLFLIDSKLHKGTSGSPIVSKFSTTYWTKDGKPIQGEERSYLVGILSGGYEELGLNAVWYARVLEELLESL